MDPPTIFAGARQIQAARCIVVSGGIVPSGCSCGQGNRQIEGSATLGPDQGPRRSATAEKERGGSRPSRALPVKRRHFHAHVLTRVEETDRGPARRSGNSSCAPQRVCAWPWNYRSGTTEAVFTANAHDTSQKSSCALNLIKRPARTPIGRINVGPYRRFMVTTSLWFETL
jgi:hypothetical protein